MSETQAATSSPDQPQSFAALRHPGARAYLIGTGLVMLADSIEHAISYWVMWQKFESPILQGFAVIAHWLPFLLFSVWSGALADRYDPRRIIQIGMVLFIIASVGWGYFFFTDTLEMWHAVVLLVIHGFAGVFWGPAGQMIIHDMLGPKQLQSGVRLLATARTLGILLGPVIGTWFMFQIGAALAITLNALIYLPLTYWLWKAPYGPKFRDDTPAPRVAIRGIADIIDTARSIAGNRTIISMTILAGAASMFVGNAYQSVMPEFATDLGAENSGFFYGALLSATAAGALAAGLVLESRSLLPAKPRSAIILVILWCFSLAGFAASTNFYLSALLLFCAGFLHLSYSSMAQTLVQLEAPAAMRGRVLGLYSMSNLGLIAFSGVAIGGGGELVGIHWALGLSAAVLLVFTVALLSYTTRTAPA